MNESFLSRKLNQKAILGLNDFVDFIVLFATHPSEYEKRCDEISNMGFDKHAKEQLKLGRFKLRTLWTSLVDERTLPDQPGGTGKGIHYPAIELERLVHRLRINGISNALIGHFDVRPDTDYLYLTRNSILQHISNGTLFNAVFGFEHALDTASEAVLHIAVKNSTGDETCGTGFVVGNTFYSSRHYALTNKHIAELEILRILNFKGDALKFGKIFQSEKYDLAAIEVPNTVSSGKLWFANESTHLEKLYSFGYPYIPFTESPAMLIHQGEINGYSRNRNGQRFAVISNGVEPGSSGGPLVNELGLIVAMTVEKLEAEAHENNPAVGKTIIRNSIFRTAIPVEEIKEFYDSLPKPN